MTAGLKFDICELVYATVLDVNFILCSAAQMLQAVSHFIPFLDCSDLYSRLPRIQATLTAPIDHCGCVLGQSLLQG